MYSSAVLAIEKLHAEASGFWLTHVGTPREGAVIVGTPPLDGSVSTMPLVPTDQLSAGGSMRRGSLTHSIAGTADSGWPQVPSTPLPSQPQQQQPHRAAVARAGSTLKSVAWNVAPVALCLWSSMTVSVMLFPVFTVVRSSGALGCMLPQALFAVRMVSDISGRVLASARQPPVSIVGVRFMFCCTAMISMHRLLCMLCYRGLIVYKCCCENSSFGHYKVAVLRSVHT